MDGRLIAGRYRVGALLGHGGMSSVHKCTDLRLGRTVAIKLLKPSLSADPAFRSRFRKEAQAAARMAHPTIVRVFDAGEEAITDVNGGESWLPFIIMEFVDGDLLKSVVSKGALPNNEAVRIVSGILTALEYSHRAGVVHRDIKPGNVMLTKNGQVKVMDFGIARAISDSSTTLAQTTAILGTASYLSPEQARGELVDTRSDLYSTGVVLFELLTGRPPFRGDSPVAVAYQHVSESATRTSILNPLVTPPLDTVVARSLAKDPYNRYQTAADFRSELEGASAGVMPKIVSLKTEQDKGLFAPSSSALLASEMALEELGTQDGRESSAAKPPTFLIWGGVLLLVASVIAVALWAIFSLTPSNTVADNSRKIPNLLSRTVADAERSLKKLGLETVKISQADDTVEVNSVIKTDPLAGVTVAPGTQIRVYVSTGKKSHMVPDVANILLSDAQKSLTAEGFVPGPQFKENSPNVRADFVLRTEPEAGSDAPQGETITFYVSSGMVTLTDLRGKPLKTAMEMLSDTVLQLSPLPKADKDCKAKPDNPVTNQSLPPGDVPQNSEVLLSYCAG